MSQADRTTNNVEPLFHPVSHYGSPEDVLQDAGLSIEEKRVILSSWASDMYVVESQPALREVPWIPHPLHLDDILAALKQLDDDTDPPPRGGLAMRPPRFSKLDCKASMAAQLRCGLARGSETFGINSGFAPAKPLAMDARGKCAAISQAAEHTAH